MPINLGWAWAPFSHGDKLSEKQTPNCPILGLYNILNDCRGLNKNRHKSCNLVAKIVFLRQIQCTFSPVLHLISRTKFIDVTYWHDGTSWRLMFMSVLIFDDDFDVVVMWILILSLMVMWRLSIELKHAIIPYNTFSTFSNHYKVSSKGATVPSSIVIKFRQLISCAG